MAEQMTDAYPLSWPAGVARTPSHRREAANFGTMKISGGRSYKTKHNRTVAECVRELQRQVGLLGGVKLVISTNLKLRLDGLPYSNSPRFDDPGAAIFFTRKGVPYAFPCDKWKTVEDNLWAIAKHLDAMRGTERWGVGSVEQQFLGYKALAAESGRGVDPWAVLGLAPMSAEAEVQSAYRTLARAAHPDAGGSAEQMAAVNLARDQALEQLRLKV